MPLMDEFKEERNAVKNGTFKEKLSYFWDYYKWYVIGTVCAIIFLSSFIYQMVTQKEVVFNAVMLNASLKEMETTYDDAFMEYAGIDTSTSKAVFDTSIHTLINSNNQTAYASAQKLLAYTAAGDIEMMITDSESFSHYANNTYFFDLRDILSEEQIAKYEPYFYYVDRVVVEEIAAANDALDTTFEPQYPDPTKPEEMAEPIPVGLYLDTCEELPENFYFNLTTEDSRIVMGVYVNTKHLENALKYIDFALN